MSGTQIGSKTRRSYPSDLKEKAGPIDSKNHTRPPGYMFGFTLFGSPHDACDMASTRSEFGWDYKSRGVPAHVDNVDARLARNNSQVISRNILGCISFQ